MVIPLCVPLADRTGQDIQSTVTNAVAGAMAIQEVIENTKSVGNAGGAPEYATYLRKKPLPDVPAMLLICQFAQRRSGRPQPDATAFLRAG